MKNKLEKILLIPDCHHPFVDKNAWQLLLKAGKKFKPDHTVILGDFLDFFDVSSHSKRPDRRFKLDEEIEAGKKALDEVKSLGAKNNVFIAGNHCDRLKRYLEQTAPELHKIISIPKILELKEKGFKYIPYKESYSIGKLHMTHDVGTAGRYAHYKALDTFQHSIAIGHTHRLGMAIEGNASGEKKVGVSLGWLGDENEVDYMHKVKIKRDWAHGFGIAYHNPTNGYVYIVPVPIVDNTCVVEGTLITL